MLFKRRASGISRREQQQRGQYAIPKDQRIRAVGDEIRRGICGGQSLYEKYGAKYQDVIDAITKVGEAY